MFSNQQYEIRPRSSASGILVTQQPSEISFNPSHIKQSSQISQYGLMKPSQQKKGQKFDQIDQNGRVQAAQIMREIKSNQNIETETSLCNCFRKLKQLLKSRYLQIFYVLMLFVFITNCIIESALISQQVNHVTHTIDFALQIFFTFHIVIKLIQFQNIQIFWLIIDITTNICGYLAFGLDMLQEPVRYLRAVKTLRLLLLIKQVSYLEIPATKLINSLSSVGKILIPAALIVYFYAVIGLYSFRDYEYSKCRDPANKLLQSNWTVYSASVFLCGEKSCPVVDGIQYECLNPIDYGVQPNSNQVHNLYQGQGLMRYNNIFYSLFSTFKQIFVTGSSRLMIMYKQTINFYYVLIYYFSFIYLVSYIYLGIFYGLLITNEEQSNDKNKEEKAIILNLNRPKSRKLTGKSKKVNNQIQEKQVQGVEFPQGIKKTSSFENLENIDSANEMINKDNEFFEKIADLENLQRNQSQILNNSKTFYGQLSIPQKFSKAQQNSNRQNEMTGFFIPQDKQNKQNMQKYAQIVRKYYILNHVIVILCSINILIDWHGQTYDERFIFDTIDFAFFWIYMAEVIIRFVVHKIYVPNEPFDILYKIDLLFFFTVAGGLIYEAATATSVRHFLMASDNASKLIRTVKYLRILLLISQTPYFKEARIIFRSTLQAFYSIRYLSALWLLILIIASIMGVHMFQGKVKIDNEGNLDLQHGHPQYIGFQGIVDSLIFTVFVFFNEEWDYFLFEQYTGQQVWIVFWVLIILVIGLQILSKYFMSMLVKQLGDRLNQVDQMDEQNQQEELQQGSQMGQSNVIPNRRNTVTPINKAPSHNQNQSPQSQVTNALQTHESLKIHRSKIDDPVMKKKRQSRISQMKEIILKQPNKGEQSQKQSQIQRVSNKIPNEFFIGSEGQEKQQEMSWIQEKRIKLALALKSKIYKAVKVFVIIVSVVCTLTMNPMNDPNSPRILVFTKIWYVTIAFFGLQIIISILAFGPFNEKNGYFRSLMNWIYIIVFAIEIVSIVPGLSEQGHIEAILSFRILRIFVLVEIKYDTDPSMRVTMVSFWKLLPKVLNLLALMAIVYSFFAIILIKLYKDDYYYCDGYDQAATIQTQVDCMNWGGSWVQRRFNVSNIFSALLYFFFVASGEGWSTQVIESASIAGVGKQPQYGRSSWLEYYFSVFFFVGNLIMLNVFIGLTVYNLQKIRNQVSGLSRLSNSDKQWLSIKNTIHRLRPKMKDVPPNNPLSYHVHQFKNSFAYKVTNIILFLIFIISMSLYMTNMNDKGQLILDTILNIFIGIFIFEYLVSWVALGHRVIKQKKFIFESVCIVYFIVVFAVSYGTHLDPKVFRMLHGVVICVLGIRYFALLNDVEFVRKMANSLLSVFPQTFNVFLVMFVTLLTYGVIGLYWFGYLKIGPELNDFDQNYTDLQRAIYALLKQSTLESPLTHVIDITAGMQPNSVCFNLYSYQDFLEHGRMGCANPIAGYIFIISFHIIYTIVLFSTLLATVVDTYSEVRRQEESMVNKFQLQAVQKQWENYDPQATGYIGYRDFWMFTAQLVKIYQVNEGELMSHQTKQSFLKSLQIPIYQDQNGVLSFQFHEVVEALTRIVLKQKMGPQWDTKKADKVFNKHNKHGSTGVKFKKSVYDSSHVLTLIVMKSGLKAWKRKAVNTQNQQNLQNLFAFAKKDKKKENGTEKNVASIQSPVKSLKDSSRQLNPPQSFQANKPAIETIKFENPKNQEEKFVIQTKELFADNKRSKSPRMSISKPEKKDARMTASVSYSKLKSPRTNIRKVQSDRQKQNLHFLTKKTDEQEDNMDELEEIK